MYNKKDIYWKDNNYQYNDGFNFINHQTEITAKENIHYPKKHVNKETFNIAHAVSDDNGIEKILNHKIIMELRLQFDPVCIREI